MEEQCQQLMSEVQALKNQLQTGFHNQNAGLEHITSVLQQLNKNSSASFMKLESLRVEETAALNIRLQEAVDVADMLKRLDEATKEVKFLKRACQNYEAEAMANADAVMELKQLKVELERMRSQELRERTRLKDLLHQSQEQLQCTQAELIEAEKKAKRLEESTTAASGQPPLGSSLLNTLSGGLVELVPSSGRGTASCSECSTLQQRLDEMAQQMAERNSELVRVKKYAQRFAKALKEQRVLRKEGWEGPAGASTPQRHAEESEGVLDPHDTEEMHTPDSAPWKAAAAAAAATSSEGRGRDEAGGFSEEQDAGTSSSQALPGSLSDSTLAAATDALREELLAQLQEVVISKQSGVDEVQDAVTKLQAMRQQLMALLVAAPSTAVPAAAVPRAAADAAKEVERSDALVQTEGPQERDVQSTSPSGSRACSRADRFGVGSGSEAGGSELSIDLSELPPSVARAITAVKSDAAMKSAQLEAASRELEHAKQQLKELSGLMASATQTGLQEAAAKGSAREYRELLELQGLIMSVQPNERRQERRNLVVKAMESNSLLEASVTMARELKNDMKQEMMMDSLSEPSTPTISEFAAQPSAETLAAPPHHNSREPLLWEHVGERPSSGDAWTLAAGNPASASVTAANPLSLDSSMDGPPIMQLPPMGNGGKGLDDGVHSMQGGALDPMDPMDVLPPGGMDNGALMVPELPPGMPSFDSLPPEFQQLFFDNPEAFYSLLEEATAHYGLAGAC